MKDELIHQLQCVNTPFALVEDSIDWYRKAKRPVERGKARPDPGPDRGQGGKLP